MVDELSSEEKRLAREVLENFAQTMYANGLLTKEDLKKKEVLYGKIQELNNNIEIAPVIDHRDDIVNHAKIF
jgi:hypothetical protein